MTGWMFMLVGIGGAAGAVIRYAVSRLLSARGMQPTAATLAVNLAGSLAVGVLLGMQLPDASPNGYALIGTGFLGGLTTFSTLNVQKAVLWNDRQRQPLLRYTAATYLGGWALTGLGIGIGHAAIFLT